MPAVRSPGLLTLGGVDLQLLKNANGGFEWTEYARTAQPGVTSPEEAVLATKTASHSRPLGFLDWSHGIGASVYRPGDLRVHWSEGVSGEHPKSLRRGDQVRRLAFGGTEPDGPVTHFFEVNDALYAVVGNQVRQITPTLNAETVATSQTNLLANGDATGLRIDGTTFTEASPLWYDGTSDKVFLATTAAFILGFDGSSWTQSADAKRSRFTFGQYSTGLHLWGTEPAATNNVRNLPQGQDPLVNANWTVTLPVSNRTSEATAMVALRDFVYVAYDDGTVYRYNSTDGTPTPIIPPEAAIRASDAGRHMCLWNGMLLVPTARGLMLFEEGDGNRGSFVPVGPEHLVGNRSPVKGPPTGLCGLDPQWLYATFYDPTGDDTYVMKGRLPMAGEQTQVRMIWQAVGMIDGERATALHLSNLGTNPVLCVGTDDPALHFVTLPRAGQTVHDDGNCRSRITAHAVYLPDHDALTPTIQETLLRMRVSSRRLSTTETVTVSISRDGGGYDVVGTLQESPYAEITFPAGTAGRSVAMKFDFQGTDDTVFPEIISVEVDYVSDGEPAEWIDCKVFVGQSQLFPSGLSRIGVAGTVAYLKSLVAADAVIIDAVGPLGTTHAVKLDRNAGVVAQAVEHIGDFREPGYVVAFRLNDYSALIAHDAAIYDSSPYTTGTVTSYYDTSG